MTSSHSDRRKKPNMKTTDSPERTTRSNPVFSIAGAMTGGSEAAWKTAYPNPDSLVAEPRPAGHGPTFTIAGVVQGAADNGWRTAMPDPTRDTLDVNGHVVSKVEAAARAELAPRRRVLTLAASTAHPHPEAA
jgi:hypothetical protein